MSRDEPSVWNRLLRGRSILLGIGLFAVVQQLPSFDRSFNFHDEGHMLLFSNFMAQGGELYRDAFVYPLPGAFHLLSWLFRLFEPSNLLARWVVVCEFAGLATMAFALLRRILSPGWALGSVAMLSVYRVWAYPQWHIYNYSTTALVLQLGALLLLLRWTDRGDRRWLAAAGLVFGLGVACKQDYGAAALLAFLATIGVAHQPRVKARPVAAAEARCDGVGASFLIFLAPACLVGTAVGVHYWMAGLLGDLIQFTVFQHFAGMSEYAYTEFPPLLPLFVQDPLLRGPVGTEAFLPGILATANYAWLGSDLFQKTAWVDTLLKAYYYAPFPILAAAAVRLWRRRRQLADPATRPAHLGELVLFLLAAALFLDVNLNRPQDFLHLAVIYWPLLLLCVIQTAGLLKGRPKIAIPLTAVLAIPAAFVVWFTGELAWSLRTLHPTLIENPRARIFATPEQARLINDLVDYIHARTEPDEVVAAMPYFPLLLFYADRVGPHRSSYMMWPVPEIPNRDEEIIAALDAKQTNLVLHNLNRFWSLGTMDDYSPGVFKHLVENFEIDRIFAYDYDYSVAAAVRKPEVQDSRLLPERADDVSVTITSDDAPPLPISPRAQSELFELGAWPFRPTLALRPTVGRRTVLSIPVEVRTGDHLVTAIGVHPSYWYRIPHPSVTFRIDVVAGDVRTTVYQHDLDPMARLEDLGWFDIDLSLDDWAGHEVVLEFSTETNLSTGQSLHMGGWEIPRLVGRSTQGARS